MEIFKLIGSVMVDTADAERSLQKTGDAAEKTGNKFADGVKTAAKWAAGVGAAAVAVGGAAIAAAKDTASAMDEIDKASQRMGVGAEKYQELAYAAQLSGVEMSTMEKAAKALEGTDLSMDDALEQIWALGTAEERSAKAAELFGDSVAYQMGPMLNASAEDMANMAQEARDLGLVMSEDTVKSGAAMNDMFTKVEASIEQLKNGLIADLFPYIEEILGWVLENVPAIRETIKSVMDAIMPIVKPILNAIMSALPPIMNAIKKLINWLLPFITPVINAVSSLINGFLSLLNGDVEGFVDGLLSFLGGLGEALYNIGSSIFSALWQGLVDIWTSIQNWVSEKVNWLIDKLAFWKKGSGEMGGNSHAGGLPYVPYDNYPAMLHRGESVMTAADSQGLLAAVEKIANNAGGGGDIHITVQSVLDGRVIGESVTKYQARKARATA